MLTLLTFITILGSILFSIMIILSIIEEKKSDQVFKRTLHDAMQFKNIHHHMVRFAFYKSAEL